MLGEVWFFSGQSNMNNEIKSLIEAENIQQQPNCPLIHYYKLPWRISTRPIDELNAAWQVCSSATVSDLSAVAYYTAIHLADSLQVPIGVIVSCYSAANIESFMSLEAMQKIPGYEDLKPLPEHPNEEFFKQYIQKELEDTLLANGATKSLVGDPGDHWMKPDFDDSHWMNMELPNHWEKYFPLLNGKALFRKRFSLPKNIAEAGVTVHFIADDNDIAWINGHEIGSTRQWNAKREYSVAPQLLKVGENILAIYVEDEREKGGIYGTASDLKITSFDAYEQSLAGPWKFHISRPKIEAYNLDKNHFPALVYNAMVFPLFKYSIKGIVWYQGESNVERAEQYRDLFPTLIQDWQEKWGQDSLPFHFVQLPTFGLGNNSNNFSDWAELREAQTSALSLPNTYMTVAVDLGERDNIHPNDKKAIGKRLAASILANSYQKNLPSGGPIFERMELKDGVATVFFKNIGSGLMAKDGKNDQLAGFELAGLDRKFYPAKAKIEGDQVKVTWQIFEDPVALRYAWVGYPDQPLNLYNKEGLPAAPFRTDDWPGITKGKVYRPKFFPIE